MQLSIENIARICHESNRAYCLALGDRSQLPWDDAPEWQRGSAINGVKFHMDNPHAGPSGSHENWLREKHANGWKYGPTKSIEGKEHPCCVPYNELPPEQRLKDALFVAIVHEML